MDKTVLTVKEAAAIMRISPSSMYQLIRDERVPYIAIGKRRVIPAARFLDWLNSATVGVIEMRGSVAKKGNRWYPRYYVGKDENGKWIQKWGKGCDTKKDAEKLLRRYLDEVESSYQRKADKSTVAVFMRHWLAVCCEPKLALNTVNGYRVNIEKHIIPYIGKIPLYKLTPADIQKLYSDLLTSGLSGTSVRYVHNNLHRALKYAVKQEIIPRNPADLVDAPRIDRPEQRVLTPDEAKRLVAASVGSDIYLPVLLGLTLGLRRGEALGLQWADIDMAAKTVTVVHSASFNKGGFTLSSTKTRNSRRTLMLSDVLFEALEAEQAKQQEAAARFGTGYNPYRLVCCLATGMPLTSGMLTHHFHDVLRDCGLPTVRFHDLRHTNATLMLRNNVPAKIVSSMLGHSSIGITMDTYSHVMTDMQEGAIGVMDRLFQDI